MKKKDGPVLITCKHEGVDSAKKVIEALEKRGIKKGDQVAFELAKIQLENLLNRFAERMLGAPIKATTDPETVFLEKVFDFLMRKDVDILPFGVGGKGDPYAISRFKKQLLLQEAGKKVSRRSKRLTYFAMFPITEKILRKGLHGKNPNFVIGGSLHFPALKKAFDHREIIDLGKPPLKSRIIAQMSRMHYKAIKAYKITKRNFARKRRI